MIYLLTLKPLKPFFFGGEQTLANEEYYGISRYFPYPTQLLGALKLYLAEQNRLITVHKNGRYANKDNREKVNRLIGTTRTKDYATQSDIGVIRRISPMILTTEEKTDAWFVTPFDFLHVSGMGGETDRTDVYRYEPIGTVPMLRGYSVKTYNPQRIGGRSFWKRYLADSVPAPHETQSFDAFFSMRRQTGIALDKRRTIDEMFYVKTSYMLRGDYLFGVLVDLDDALFAELKLPNKTIRDGTITLGAEGSIFGLRVHEIPEALKGHPVISQWLTPHEPSGEKAVAISPAISNEPTDQTGAFSFVPHFETQRMLEDNGSREPKEKRVTENDGVDYSSFKGKTAPKRLIPAGTVFYRPATLPKAPGVFGKIGYNTFITTQGASHV